MTTISNLIINDVDVHPPVESSRVLTARTEIPADEKLSLITDENGASAPRAPRESGDDINRFLFCVLAVKSVKQIKARAERAGEQLPIAKVVKGVLRSYNRAAQENPGILTGQGLNLTSLRKLNDGVLKDEIARHTQGKVKNSQAQLAQAKRVGDETRIKLAEDILEHAISDRDRIAGKLSGYVVRPSDFKQY